MLRPDPISDPHRTGSAALRRAPLAGAALLLFAVSACSRTSATSFTAPPVLPGGPHTVPTPNAPPPAAPRPQDPPTGVQLGDPLPGLTPAELASFERGRAMFSKRFKPSEGLGPLYNATSCQSCHSEPVAGGGSDLYRNFYVGAVEISPGNTPNVPGLPSPAIPAFGSGAGFTTQGARFRIPETFANFPVITAQRNSIPVFGVGLFEFITNATILANADPEDTDGDGISGRINNDGAGVGRFGLKAQSNSIEFFTRAPLMNQMGITSNPFQGAAGTISINGSLGSGAHSMGAFAGVQGSANPNQPTTDTDGVPDPEITPDDLGDLIAFSRFLAPPQPKPFDAAATRGDAQFRAIGCADCHVPSMESSRGPVWAYTDLLLHDMGPGLADRITFGTPQMSSTDPFGNGHEFRTQPLWGISHFAPYLHDGRAATLDDAIRLHGGEAKAATDAYVALPQGDRDDILAFLRHL